MNFKNAEWINEPQKSFITESEVRITTDSGTDFWQRSYYGFRNDNAPALLLETMDNFTLTARVEFQYKSRFDQAGLIIYQNSENWFKASMEYEDSSFSRLGSVVTNKGYSDWATSDVDTVNEITYRLSRRGPDFLIEQSFDGKDFRQMRVFHMHVLGETTEEMGKLNPPAPAEKPMRFGLYACSPLETSFEAVFDNIVIEESLWKAHE